MRCFEVANEKSFLVCSCENIPVKPIWKKTIFSCLAKLLREFSGKQIKTDIKSGNKKIIFDKMFERIFKFSGQPDILPISRPAYGEPSNKQPGYKRQILNTFTFFKTENSTGTFVDIWMKVTYELELNILDIKDKCCIFSLFQSRKLNWNNGLDLKDKNWTHWRFQKKKQLWVNLTNELWCALCLTKHFKNCKFCLV